MPATLAIICDIDDTICIEFNQPVAAACALLRELPRYSIEVHYVTARSEESKEITESFLVEQRLPTPKNLHLCPRWKGTLRHKREAIREIVRYHRVLLSVGDQPEEETASIEAKVPFVRINPTNFEEGWRSVAALLRPHFKPSR